LPLAKHLVVTTFVSAMLGDIDLIFDLWVFNDELQIKFTFRSVSLPKIIQPEWISKLICNLWLYSHTKNQVNISNRSEIKWWQLNIWTNFKSPTAASWPKIIQPEEIYFHYAFRYWLDIWYVGV
jgi:hypothetical protein